MGDAPVEVEKNVMFRLPKASVQVPEPHSTEKWLFHPRFLSLRYACMSYVSLRRLETSVPELQLKKIHIHTFVHSPRL